MRADPSLDVGAGVTDVLPPVLEALRTVIGPELSSGAATDACALVDRLLVRLLVEADEADALAPRRDRWRALVEAEDVDPGAVLAAEREVLDLVDAACAARSAPTPRTGGEREAPGLDPAALTAWLRRNGPAPEVVVTAVEAIPGGRVKETYRCTLAGGGAGLPDRVVVRKDKPSSLIPTTAAGEYDLLRLLHATAGIPVAEPLLVERDPGRMGGTFLVSAFVTGQPAGDLFLDLCPPLAHGAAVVRHLAQVLGRLHSLDPVALAGVGIAMPDERVQLEQAVEGITGRFPAAVDRWPAGVTLAQGWLRDHLEQGLQPLALAHNDVGLHNLLVEGPRITALLDWEMAAPGPPSRDLARAWPLVERYLSPQEFTACYREAGGPATACTPEAVGFHRVLAMANGAATACYAGHLVRTGAGDLVLTHAAVELRRRSQRMLIAALDAVRATG